MLDHPVTQKVLITVASAGIVAVGGTAWQSSRQLERHDVQIRSIEKTQDVTLTELSQHIEEIRKDVGEIKEGVAVLNERTEHYEAEKSGKPRP